MTSIENVSKGSKLFGLAIFWIALKYVQSDCDFCQSRNSVACHSETVFSLCIDGNAQLDYITCPEDHVCTQDVFVCYHKNEAVVSCSKKQIDSIDTINQCGICDSAGKVFSCIDETTIAFCFGSSNPNYESVAYCPKNTVCDLNNSNDFCSEDTKISPSCKKTSLPPDDEVNIISTTATKFPTTIFTEESSTLITTEEPTIFSTTEELESFSTTDESPEKPTISYTTEKPETTKYPTVTTEEVKISTAEKSIDTTITTFEVPITREPTTPKEESIITSEKRTITTTIENPPKTTTEHPTITTTTSSEESTTKEPIITTKTTTTEDPTTDEPTTEKPTSEVPTTEEPATFSTTLEPCITEKSTNEVKTTTADEQHTSEKYTTKETAANTEEPTTSTTTEVRTTTTTERPIAQKPRDADTQCKDIKKSGSYKPDGDKICKTFVLCYYVNSVYHGIIQKCSTGQYFDPIDQICQLYKPDGCD